jgi:hypothetical protein
MLVVLQSYYWVDRTCEVLLIFFFAKRLLCWLFLPIKTLSAYISNILSPNYKSLHVYEQGEKNLTVGGSIFVKCNDGEKDTL